MDDRSLLNAILLFLLGAILVLVGVLAGVIIMQRGSAGSVGGTGSPEPRGVVQGYVWEDADGDGNRDTGEGTSGVTVTLEDASGAEEDVTTNSIGYYGFYQLVDDNYTVSVSGGGSTPVTIVNGGTANVDFLQ